MEPGCGLGWTHPPPSPCVARQRQTHFHTLPRGVWTVEPRTTFASDNPVTCEARFVNGRVRTAEPGGAHDIQRRLASLLPGRSAPAALNACRHPSGTINQAPGVAQRRRQRLARPGSGLQLPAPLPTKNRSLDWDSEPWRPEFQLPWNARPHTITSAHTHTHTGIVVVGVASPQLLCPRLPARVGQADRPRASEASGTRAAAEPQRTRGRG